MLAPADRASGSGGDQLVWTIIALGRADALTETAEEVADLLTASLHRVHGRGPVGTG